MCDAAKSFGSFTFPYKHFMLILSSNPEKLFGSIVPDEFRELEPKRKIKYNKVQVYFSLSHIVSLLPTLLSYKKKAVPTSH
jgi:hypothetical protein